MTRMRIADRQGRTYKMTEAVEAAAKQTFLLFTGERNVSLRPLSEESYLVCSAITSAELNQAEDAVGYALRLAMG